MEKEKKKTLTISSNFKKKIAPNFLSKKDGKKSYFLFLETKKMFLNHLKLLKKHLTRNKILKIKNSKEKNLLESL